MAQQLFPQSANFLAKGSLFGSLFGAAFTLWLCLTYTRSSYGTGAGMNRVQPVFFSHEHHVGALGIDCRYCHTSVEDSAFAGIPPTKTCMNCHSQIWTNNFMLEPVRESYRTGESIRWQRVYNLPGFVYFDHSIHVQKGVGCASCHGQIDEMQLTRQVPSLLMEWCLNCHRRPENELRPREEVFNMKYQKPDDQAEFGMKLKKEYGVRDAHTLTSCSACHR
jgi:hypothetical protein